MTGTQASYFGMHGVDLAVGAWLLLFALRGYARGLFREVMAVLALVLALVAAFRWTPDVMPRFAQSIPGPSSFDTAVVFLFLFGLTEIALRILAAIITGMWGGVNNAQINRVGGAAFGMTKGALMFGSTVLMLRTFTPAPLPHNTANPLAGLMQKVNQRLDESMFAGELAELTSSLFSTVVDAAEIRLRMLAASDNEGP